METDKNLAYDPSEQLESQLSQQIDITTDGVVFIRIKNSTINIEYGMPVVAFWKCE